MSIDSEEFRAALNHMVNMDDEWGVLPMKHTEDRAHCAAMAFLKFVDNYCDNQSVVHKKRIEKLEESLSKLVRAANNLNIPEGECPGYGFFKRSVWEAEDALKP